MAVCTDAVLVSAMGCALLVFLKEPEAGRVKTRLGADIGNDRAAQLYQSFLLDWLERLDGFGRSRGVAIVPCCAPDGAVDRVAALLDREVPAGAPWPHRCRPQGEGDLGDRLIAAFQGVWDRGGEHAIAVGTDSPDLPLAYLDRGFEVLAGGDCLLGPADDGGYYAIGFSDRTFTPSAFADIPWSSADTAAHTLSALALAGRCTTLLPPWSDIDRLDDLRRLAGRLGEPGSDWAPLTRTRQALTLLDL